MMAGPEPDMQAETDYMTLLAAAKEFQVDGETLTLLDGGGNIADLHGDDASPATELRRRRSVGRAYGRGMGLSEPRSGSSRANGSRTCGTSCVPRSR